METQGNRKLLAALMFGLLSLAALVVIILLKQFSADVFKAWMTGTASVFGIFMTGNVVAKFSPEAGKPRLEVASAAPGMASKPNPKERGGSGLFGVSGKSAAKRAAKARKGN